MNSSPHSVIASHSTGLMAWQSGLFFNGLKFVFLFLLLLTTIGFFGLKKAKAQEEPLIVIPPKVVINEVYYNPDKSNDTTKEWITIYNIGNDVNLNDYLLAAGNNYIFPSIILFSGETIKIHWNTDGINSDTDLYTGDSGFDNIKDISGSVALFKSTTKSNLTIIDYLEYGASGQTWEPTASSAKIWIKGTFIPNVTEGYSLQRNPIDQDTNMIFDFIPYQQILPPEKPVLLSPLDNQILTDSNDLNFTWQGNTNTQEYQFILSNDINFNSIVDLADLTDTSYQTSEDLSYGTYYWRVIAKNDFYESDPSESSFILQEIVYSKSIIINEIYPRPENGADNEFIELCNSGDEEVDLSGWFLDDIDGGSSSYEIPVGTIILGRGYLVFYRSETGIALNDSGGDSARLLYPNNEIANSISYSENAPLGLSYARGSTGKWDWTTTPTKFKKNIITAPAVVTDQTDELVINTIPIEIPTGDFENYLDKLVKIRGKVISTSGNTFYLDDGSGVIKVYIQEKTGITKPEMHRNDIFEIIGVVDLYGQTWRILPRTLSDILLIETAPVVTKTTTAKKVVSKAVTAIKSPIISKAVAAAATSPLDENTDKNDTLNQIVKTSLGLAVMSLVFLIFKLWHQPKVKTIGGHFGDDET